jgi:hypothetical protein
MANPRFTDENGNFGYTWAELPIVPSDRPDIEDPMNVDRALLEFAQAGIIRQTKFLTERGRWTIRFRAITRSMVISLQFFFGKAFIRFIPDADDLATYKEVFISNQFRPTWQPGDRYDLTLELRQYSP